MKPLEDIYKASFFKNRHKLSWRVPYVCDAIIKVFRPASVIDIGCGIGDYVKGFQERNLVSYGVEGSDNCLNYLVIHARSIIIHDLREPILVRSFDLVVCFEVLEHIEPEYTNILVNNLTSLSDRILVSAAPPGQGGHYHVNCQHKQWWEDTFKEQGYSRVLDVENDIRNEWAPVKHKKEMSAYYNNLLYFQKNTSK